MRNQLLKFLLVMLAISSHAVAERPRGYIARPLEPGVSYSQRASDAYQAGTWILDEIAAAETPPTHEEAAHIYERARAAFEEAVDAEPAMYEAHTYLGYIHRKLGRFDASLQAYETALDLKPNYAHAIEYQAEAFLGLDDFARARFNYLRLYALDPTLASKLFDAIHAWTRDANNASDSELESARAFVVDRAR